MLLSIAAVVYSSSHMVVFVSLVLNNVKSSNVEVSDKESDRISQKIENVLIPVL